MTLQGRNLSLRMKGEDVKLLHGELRKLGYKIPAAETSKQIFGASTRQAVLDFQKEHRLETTGVVDERTAKRINAEVDALEAQPEPSEPTPEPQPEPGTFIVRGEIRQADGSLLVDGIVRAFDKDMRSEEQLGEAISNQAGRYEIKYTVEQFSRAEKKNADLIVRVLNREGLPLAASPIIFNAEPVETVDLVIGGEEYRGPSEYDRYVKELTPVLQGVPLADLTEEDVAFLAGETGINPEHIAFLAVGAKLGQETDLQPEAFYGFFRQNLPTNLPALLAQSLEVHRRALETAFRENIIPARLRVQIDAILERLRQLIVEHAFEPPDGDGRTSLGDLLNTVIPVREKQKAFLSRYVRHEGQTRDFWTALREDPEFRGDVDNLQFTIQLGILTQNNLPLVRELQKTYNSARDLVELDAAAWRRLIDKQVDGRRIGFPPDVPGADDAEKAKNYADMMVRMVEEAFPIAVIAHRLSRETSPDKEDLRKFFAQSPGFDLATTRVETHFELHPESLPSGDEEREKLRNDLKSMQRLFKLTRNYDEMQALRDDSLHSARSIARMGKTAFVARYASKLGGTGKAKAIYSQARHNSAMALALYTKHSAAVENVELAVTAKPPAQVEGIPDWKTLFGPLDLCECEHCRSVYSPAAYLVDILELLKNSPENSEGKTPLDVLFSRRPDLGEIELSCENTNTPLPYVDLVNEILEGAVSPWAVVPQTRGTPEELSANPERINEEAYHTVAKQLYPWTLPFDLWAEEARVYLGHLGVPRSQLMETFHKQSPADSLTDIAVASEHLGLTTAERQIITGAPLNPPRSPWEFWGFQSEEVADPTSPDGTTKVSWTEALRYLPLFLEMSGLSYNGLRELLGAKFINPTSTIALHSADPATCDLEKIKIQNLTEPALKRIHGFVRLQRKLGWTVQDLDRAITALKALDLEDNFLLKLSHIKRIQHQLNVPLVQMLSWWGTIGTTTYNEDIPPKDLSLYERLFLNKRVVNPVDEIFELNVTRDELANSTGKISEHVPAILAALEISGADLSFLTASEVTDDKLTLSNLSHLYQIVSFSKALKLSIRDYLSVKALTGINPFDSVKTEDTLRFVEKVGKIRASGFSIAQLDYLLRHVFRVTEPIAPTEKNVAVILQEIHGGLVKIAAEPQEARENFVKQKLAVALNLEVSIAEHLLIKRVKSPADPTENSIEEFLSKDPSKPAEFEVLFKTFTRLQKIATIISRFKITSEELSQLFKNSPSLAWLDFNSLPIAEAASSPTLFAAWERLVDLFVLLNTLPSLREKLTSSEWRKLKTAFGVSEGTADEQVKELSQTALLALLGLAARFNPATGNPVEAEAQFLQTLSERTEWNLEDMKFLAGADGFGLQFPDDYKQERSLIRIKACFDLIKRLGVSAAEIGAWIKPDLLPVDARTIKQAAKAMYEEKQWLALAKPLRDFLREKQRSALVANLVAKMGFKDSNGLLEHYLIDVEMDPCMVTSRIKQAISSVQLFIQRSLMGLEPQAALHEEAAREWKWMKNYRVWEANRKVFLYPENWIEPELRDDKSPFFKDLENELFQDEVAAETTETAFLNYLEKLDAVARLEICGMYHQKEDGIDVLHVFSRTRGIPHIYYYRRRIESAYWTPWEKVDVDIEGDHLIPVVWNRRPYLFWPIFTEATEQQPIIIPKAGEALTESPKHWEIQIAWSEYKNNKWSAKTVSKEKVLGLDFLSPSTPKDQLTFRARFEGNEENRDLMIYLGPSEVGFSRSDTGETFYKWPGFRIAGCGGTIVLSSYASRRHLPLLPPYTHIECMKAAEDPGDQKLDLVAAETDGNGDVLTGTASVIRTLNLTPNTFQILYPHQFPDFVAQAPFFYQDDTKTFLVIPRSAKSPQGPFNGIDKPDRLPLEWIGEIDRASSAISPTSFSAGPSSVMVAPTNRSIGGVETTFRTFASGESPGLTYSAHRLPSGAFTGANISVILNPKFPGKKPPTLPNYRAWRNFRFQTFYHPYACEFTRELNRYGIDGFLDPPASSPFYRQAIRDNTFFEVDYAPTEVVDRPYPAEGIDFSYDGAYSLYNWELFFHAPLLIADRLNKNQRFEEAQKWFHYIFDPTSGSSDPAPQRYWKIRPFFEAATGQPIQELLQLLDSTGADPTVPEEKANLQRQVEQWRNDPFKPHLIARLRTTAYQKTVVMKYIDNLIAWGDYLFRRDTIESINEATQLYILAAEILGKRPEKIPPRAKVPVKTYKQLEPLLDAFSNAVVQIENLLPPSSATLTASDDEPLLALGTALYFCIPKNDKLLGYWDTVADRLFKIRHCMNIEGVFRQLPLFESPIEPGLVVKAAAAGVDISSALVAALPHYRFNVMAQKAAELCADLKSLGAALLSALEKRDAEVMALLRSTHEINVLNAVRQVREKQVEEATRTLEGLKKARDMVKIRHTYYADIQFMNPAEMTHLALLTASLRLQVVQAQGHVLASLLHLLPNFKIGAPTSVGSTLGGDNVGNASKEFSEYVGSTAAILNTIGSMSATLGGYQRRFDDWKLQERLAAKELEQTEKQIIAAEIRLAIAEKELQNHDLQVENAKEVDTYMHDKFTNRELYDWMVSQISSIYFQSYQLVYDVAKRAERAYRHELGLEDSNFIQFGYWDSLKKGLLAGELLYHDLKRMEVAYLDQHKREYEITTHVSLLSHDPLALITLKETGLCEVELSEALFDADYPGHYMRRIKSASLTIPCIVGPYTSINCTLTLLNDKTRVKSLPAEPYAENPQSNDNRFVVNFIAMQSIATSHAQNDSGMFELNFRDERYLPFEGAGVESRWRIDMLKDCNAFDFETISDVVMTIKYTARDGGDVLKNAARKDLQQAIADADKSPLVRLFSLRREFPTEWHRFVTIADTNGDHTGAFALTKNRFPFLFRGKEIKIFKVDLYILPKPDVAAPEFPKVEIKIPAETTAVDLADGLPIGRLLAKTFKRDVDLKIEERDALWTLTVRKDDVAQLQQSADDIVMVCHYTLA